MARLQDLPSELVTMIIKNLPELRDTRHLSQTCRDLYEHAKPELYRCIKISTCSAWVQKSAFNALLLLQKYPQHVKELTVKISAVKRKNIMLGPARHQGSEVDSGTDDERWLSDIGPLTALLSGNPFGGNIQTLILDFPFPNAYSTSDRCRMWEIWRLTLERLDTLLRAAAANLTIKTLYITWLPPYNSPVFQTDAWHSLMGRLENLQLLILNNEDIRIRGGNPEYPSWFTKSTGAGIAKNFLNHMVCVRRVGIFVFGGICKEQVFDDRPTFKKFVERFAQYSNDDLCRYIPPGESRRMRSARGT